MKLKFSFAILLVCMLPFAAHSAETKDFRCGTNLSTRAFAYRVNGTWKGFDADICRAFAWAIHGDGNKAFGEYVETVGRGAVLRFKGAALFIDIDDGVGCIVIVSPAVGADKRQITASAVGADGDVFVRHENPAGLIHNPLKAVHPIEDQQIFIGIMGKTGVIKAGKQISRFVHEGNRVIVAIIVVTVFRLCRNRFCHSL